jgi:hypothetical protein
MLNDLPTWSRVSITLPASDTEGPLSGRGLPFSGRHFSNATREEARV